MEAQSGQCSGGPLELKTKKKRAELIQGHPPHQWMYLSTRSIINALLPRNMQSNILQLRSIYGTSEIMGQRWRDDSRQSGRNERSLRLLAKVFVPSDPDHQWDWQRAGLCGEMK